MINNKNIHRLIFFTLLSSIILVNQAFSTKSFAAINDQAISYIADLLGIRPTILSAASVSVDNKNNSITIKNTSDKISCLEISKISNDWSYHFYDFPQLDFLNSNTFEKITISSYDTSIQMSGNTFSNIKKAFSIYDRKLFTSNESSTNLQHILDYTSSQAESNKIGSYFTINKSTYMISGNNTVSYVKTSSNQKKILIPSSVIYNSHKYKVTTINAYAFKKNKKIKEITIPNTITTIEQKAFENCKHLRKIKIFSKKLKTIKKDAFSGINKHAKFFIYTKSKTNYNTLTKKIKKRTNRKDIIFIQTN